MQVCVISCIELLFLVTDHDDRKRHIKCDEQQPKCMNCISTGFACEGSAQQDFKSWVPPVRKQSSNQSIGSITWAVSSQPDRTEQQRRAFDFFVSYVSAKISSPSDYTFWTGFIPQIAQSNTMTWLAVAAIATLFENSVRQLPLIEPKTGSESLDAHHRSALSLYSQSIGVLRKSTSKSYDACDALLSTVLFAAIEMMQGKSAGAMALMCQAFALNSSLRLSADTTRKEIIKTIAPVLMHMGLPLAVFGMEISPIQRQLLMTRVSPLVQIPSSLTSDTPSELYEIAYQIQNFANNMSSIQSDEEKLQMQIELFRTLKSWRHRFDEVSVSSPGVHPAWSISERKVLYHAMIVKLSCVFDKSSMAYDDHDLNFQEIICQSEIYLSFRPEVHGYRNASIFTFGMGSIPYLFFAAWACRRSKLRRRAIELLRSKAPVQESLWTRDACLKVLEGVIAFEEDAPSYTRDRSPDQQATVVPADRRLPMGSAIDQSQLPRELCRDAGTQRLTDELCTIRQELSDGSSQMALRVNKKVLNKNGELHMVERIYPLCRLSIALGSDE